MLIVSATLILLGAVPAPSQTPEAMTMEAERPVERALDAVDITIRTPRRTVFHSVRAGVSAELRRVASERSTLLSETCGFAFLDGEEEFQVGEAPSRSFFANGESERVTRIVESWRPTGDGVEALRRVRPWSGDEDLVAYRLRDKMLATSREGHPTRTRSFEEGSEYVGDGELFLAMLRARLSALAYLLSTQYGEQALTTGETFYVDLRDASMGSYVREFGMPNGLLAFPGTATVSSVDTGASLLVSIRWGDCMGAPVFDEKLVLTDGALTRVDRVEYLHGLGVESLEQSIDFELDSAAVEADFDAAGDLLYAAKSVDSSLGVSVLVDGQPGPENMDWVRTAVAIGSRTLPFTTNRIAPSFPGYSVQDAAGHVEVELELDPVAYGTMATPTAVLRSVDGAMHTILGIEVGCDVGGHEIVEKHVAPGEPGIVQLAIGHFEPSARSYTATVFLRSNEVVRALRIEIRGAAPRQPVFLPAAVYLSESELSLASLPDLELLPTVAGRALELEAVELDGQPLERSQVALDEGKFGASILKLDPDAVAAALDRYGPEQHLIRLVLDVKLEGGGRARCVLLVDRRPNRSVVVLDRGRLPAGSPVDWSDEVARVIPLDSSHPPYSVEPGENPFEVVVDSGLSNDSSVVDVALLEVGAPVRSRALLLRLPTSP